VGVTNIWHILNLRESPFFQDPLDPTTGGHYPIRLFVGREEEAEHILRGMGSAPHSRHAIQGPPGVGKTTLVQYIKAQVAEDGWLADANAIPVTSTTTAEELLVRILATVHDALGARDETLLQQPPMQEVRQLLALERERSASGSIGLPLIGSLGAGTAPQRFTGPGALMVQPTRLLRELNDLAHRHLQAPGILIHLNNLENITEADQKEAARIVRDLRDQALMYPGFHFVLAGTDDAIRTIVAEQEQLRSIFSNPGSLRPLGISQLHALLELRYRYLRVDETRPWIEPVTKVAVENLYELFDGNLRGTLHALDEAAKILVGRGEDPTEPMSLERMAPVLFRIYHARMHADLTAAQVSHLTTITGRWPTGVITPGAAEKVLQLKRHPTYTLFSELVRKGYLTDAGRAQTGRPGRPEQQYALTGQARLALGALSP
jgi:Cdc6-like AAA superfamily ATPase